LSRDSFRAVVETVRGGFEDKGPEHCRLGLLLQEGTSPSTGDTSLKRKASTAQPTPPPTKRRLNFFTSRGVVSAATSVTSCREDGEAYVIPASSTLDDRKVGLIHSPHPGLVAGLTEIQTQLNRLIAVYGREDTRGQQEEKQVDCDKTRENSLSPEEYLGIYQARDLALRATLRPIAPPDLSSPTHRRLASTGPSVEPLPSSANELDAPQPDVEGESPPAISLATILAAGFHSADASEKKEIRKRAKQENVVTAFEEEICRLKWESCLRLLHVSFDFLFLAETWFVGHVKYVRDRRFVSSTPLPSPSLQRTRNGGALYLLASASARGRLLDHVKVTPSTITFNIDGLSVSGIYLQPSMSCEDVAATLRSVATSTVVMGDVNARLPWLETQSGRPGPPERVEALSDFVRH
ncbi:hypothetical protein MBLNU13_g02312t1, partial [Cladosporium sp. NU13]